MNATEQTNFANYQERIRKAILVGIIGEASDQEELLERLDACGSMVEIDRFRRMCQRWTYATEALPPWLNWEEELENTRN